ncbi:MAG: hypothetical protein ABF651_10705 [Sporolactobacillus sp.]
MNNLQTNNGFILIPLEKTIKWKNREINLLDIDVSVTKIGQDIDSIFTLGIDIANNRLVIPEELVEYVDGIVGRNKRTFFFTRKSFRNGIINGAQKWLGE